MKVALVAPLVSVIREPQGGGSQVFVADLARGLVRRGHEVRVYAATGSQIPGVTVIDTGVDAQSLAATLFRASASAAPSSGPAPNPAAPNPAAAAAFAAAYSAVRQTRCDVVHNHAFDAPAVELAAGLNAPVVHTLHLPPDPTMAAALNHAARSAAPPAVACVSPFQASTWRPVARVDAILPPYVPTSVIPWSGAAGHGAVFAGRLSPEKGAAEAIDIARAAGIPIDVYGDAYDAEYAREQIGPRRDAPGVTVHPGIPRAELWTAMARAAVVICPAKWDEPFGMAAAEAQACGTPVVAFRRGGLGEMIADGVSGYLVAPGDLPAAIDRVRKSAGLSRQACRDHAEKHLDLERSLDAHEHLYRQVTGAGARTPAGG
jgi:glycosyltransferase involved in cell wall biosynthesis